MQKRYTLCFAISTCTRERVLARIWNQERVGKGHGKRRARINVRIAYFPYPSVLRKKNVRELVFSLDFASPWYIAFIPFRLYRSLARIPSLFLLLVAPAFLSFFFPKKESGTNWLTST